MAVYLFASILVMLVGSLRNTRLKIRIYCVKRRYRRSRRFLQGYLQMTHGERRKRMHEARCADLADHSRAAEDAEDDDVDDKSDTNGGDLSSI